MACPLLSPGTVTGAGGQMGMVKGYRISISGYPNFQENCSLVAKKKLINCLQECEEWNNQLLRVTLLSHHQLPHNKITWIGHKLRRSPPLPTNPIPVDLNDLERLGDAIGASGVMLLTSNVQKWSLPVVSTSLSRWYGHPYASSCQHVMGWTFCHRAQNEWRPPKICRLSIRKHIGHIVYAVFFHRSESWGHFGPHYPLQNAVPMTSRPSSRLTVLVHPNKDSRRVTWLVEPIQVEACWDFMLLFKRRKGTFDLCLYNIRCI